MWEKKFWTSASVKPKVLTLFMTKVDLVQTNVNNNKKIVKAFVNGLFDNDEE